MTKSCAKTKLNPVLYSLLDQHVKEQVPDVLWANALFRVFFLDNAVSTPVYRRLRGELR